MSSKTTITSLPQHSLELKSQPTTTNISIENNENVLKVVGVSCLMEKKETSKMNSESKCLVSTGFSKTNTNTISKEEGKDNVVTLNNMISNINMNSNSKTINEKVMSENENFESNTMSNTNNDNLSDGDIKEIIVKKNSETVNNSSSVSNSNMINSTYIESMKNLVSEAIPLLSLAEEGKISYTYKRDSVNSSSESERMKRLTLDLQAFENGHLPLYDNGTGIFVRFDEDNPSFLKCLITGPEGTPYSFGLFEFDIKIPSSFPSVPPQVQFCTTMNGQIRFNPNLYTSGFVCLSLLGTWDGPSWNPKLGSITQVMNSLQALVLVDHPILNEPDIFGITDISTLSDKNLESSLWYNSCVREATLRYAITRHLTTPSPIWKPIIFNHFNCLKSKIDQMIQEWINQAPENEINNSVKSYSYIKGVGVRGTKAAIQDAYDEMKKVFEEQFNEKSLKDVSFNNDVQSGTMEEKTLNKVEI